ncbi:hypothetical protein SH501x_001629 [Pirellulaceae bacterium SH501]
MKPSPIGSKILSAYAILFAGLAPAAIMVTAVVNGVATLPYSIGVISLSVGIVYYGVRVFTGDYAAARIFGLLVAVSYLGLALSNALNFRDFPEGSRAAQMAVSRMIRGVLFAAVYVWYYWLRDSTVNGFSSQGTVDAPAATD